MSNSRCIQRSALVLAQSATIRTLVRNLGLNRLANWWLARHPVVRRLPDSGIVYRVSRLESFLLADELLEQNTLYDFASLPRQIDTFVDLGSNVGYFTCWLAHMTRNTDLKGLLIDANPQAVVESRWHLAANNMTNAIALHGVVGERNGAEYADFFLYESNVCSASHVPQSPDNSLGGRWEKISVKRLLLSNEWSRHFPGVRCNLLKIDIEGSELQFLNNENTFLDRVDSIIIEWHKWRVSYDDMSTVLRSAGFILVRILEENAAMGTAVFSRL